MVPPEVLVVMPLYNARPYVKAAIDSILKQTHQNFRLLVINDGSTDGCEREVRSIQDSRVIVWNQKNKGPGSIMNLAVQYALAKHIPLLARMDADDISLPQRLDTQIRLLERFPSVAACSANCYYIDADSDQIIGSSTVSISPRIIRWEITHGLRGLIQGTCLFRTSALAEVGGYRSEFKRAEEVDLFLRLVERNELRNCCDFLYKIRIRFDSFSIQNVRQNIYFQFYALDCAKKRLNGNPERDFSAFLHSMSLTTKFRIWREEYVMNVWRAYLLGGHLHALILIALLDPRRVIIRGIRKLDEKEKNNE